MNESEKIPAPLLFQNTDLLRNLESGRAISQKQLINLWNSHHFADGMVYVQLRHPKYKEDILVWAHPEPCGGDSMTCRWPEESREFIENADILSVIFTNGLSLLLVPSQLKDVERDYFTIHLPENGYVLGQRRARRYLCKDIKVEVVQNGFYAQGRLVDFSALAFSVEVSPEEVGSFRWFNAGKPSTIHLYRNELMVFSSSCKCIRQTSDHATRNIVFSPTVSQLSQGFKKKFRNPRVEVNPLPKITFDHPATRKKIQLDVYNLSTSGFAVHVAAEEDVLMAGMIIPDVTINYGGTMKIKCKAQVLYRGEDKKEGIHYGFGILDMNVVSYDRLSHIVINVIDPHIHVADEVDVNQLWEFLFESGFIYPKKYKHVQAYRHIIKETYRKLYRENPEIITHVTYQRNGRIYAHMSWVRSYERTWMVHHLAARPFKDRRTGLQFLKQTMRYFDGYYRLPGVGMDYMMFYFRPENKFPSYFFGGFARHFNDPRACSLDLFSYLSYPTSDKNQQIPAGWSLESFMPSDIDELDRFYNNVSGGLLLDVLRLGKEQEDVESLSELYARHGLKRSYQSFSLKEKGMLKAVLIVNQSDPGLSLSDFLNGIKIIVNDTAGLPWETLSVAISQLVGCFTIDKIPVLIYPSSYLEANGVPCEKNYNLWILSAHYGREFCEYMIGKTKMRLKLLIRTLFRIYLKK
ncbi:hypothetical protein DS62_00615 [Smithella sp. SC_K08D17]|jgi:hypothetical protein|nr:hypothetical protein KD27_02395 [Smithella sp. D17]KIE17781.1 hypothetical protein DS62_00615 [Smithella sp. SC_K08D17]